MITPLVHERAAVFDREHGTGAVSNIHRPAKAVIHRVNQQSFTTLPPDPLLLLLLFRLLTDRRTLCAPASCCPIDDIPYVRRGSIRQLGTSFLMSFDPRGQALSRFEYHIYI